MCSRRWLVLPLSLYLHRSSHEKMLYYLSISVQIYSARELKLEYTHQLKSFLSHKSSKEKLEKKIWNWNWNSRFWVWNTALAETKKKLTCWFIKWTHLRSLQDNQKTDLSILLYRRRTDDSADVLCHFSRTQTRIFFSLYLCINIYYFFPTMR